MKVFVAYGYTDPEIDFVEKLAIPMLGSVGIDVITGKEVPGTSIDDSLRTEIDNVDALIGFLLKRGKRRPDRSYNSSDYVRQEINIAVGRDKPVIQIVETGVPPVEGMLKGRQRLDYNGREQASFLLEMIQHVREWIQSEVYVHIGPDALVDAIARQGSAQRLLASYRIWHQGHHERTGKSEIFPDGGSLSVKLIGFREGRQAEVAIDIAGQRWSNTVAHSNPFVTMTLAQPLANGAVSV